MSRKGTIVPRLSPSALLPYALLALLALALMVPALRVPPMLHDSFWIDYVWLDQFAAQLRQGILYPRWLPRSNGGLGAPVFYYYAPLSFYWAAAFKLTGLGTYAALIAAFGGAWFASGAAMLRWLRDCGRRGLPAAALYMLLPYHVIDFYRRGALAEFGVYAVLPLLALAVRRAAAGRGYAPLALAYAALILTHLPLALLASLFLIAPWTAWLAWRDRHAAMPLAAGLALGLGLAGIYLVPALTLQSHVSFDQLWSASELRASNWTFFTPSRWPDGRGVMLFVGMTALMATTAALFALRGDRWAWWAIGVCALVAGVVPGLWDVPMLAAVQFPWRALLLVEFGLVTAVARSRLSPMLSLAAVAPLLMLTVPFLEPLDAAFEWTPATLDQRHPEVLEYLPPGASHERGTYSPWALDLAQRQPPVVQERGRTILALFYFPSWEVSCGGESVPASPDPATKLFSYHGGGCTLYRVVLPAEWIGGAVSLASLLVLIALALRRKRRRVREAVPPGPSLVSAALLQAE